MSNTNRSNTRRREANAEFFSDFDLFGLRFYGNEFQSIDFDRPISCIPSIFLFDSNQKAIFDFSGCSGDDYLDDIISNITAGDTLTVSNAQYAEADIESDLTGKYIFEVERDKFFVCTVNSLTSGESYDKKYVNTNFIQSPEVVFGVSGGFTTGYHIQNLYGKDSVNSFKANKVVRGDTIKITEGTNEGFFSRITDLEYDDNGNEILRFSVTGPTLAYEDRFSVSTNIRLYKLDNVDGFSGSAFYSPSTGTYLKGSDTTLQYNPVDNFVYIRPELFSAPYLPKIYIARYKEPNLIFFTGTTYVFNTIGNASGFRLSKTSGGIWNGGEELNDDEVTYLDNTIIYKPKTARSIYYYDKNNADTTGMIVTYPSSDTGALDNITIAPVSVTQVGGLNDGTVDRSSTITNPLLYTIVGNPTLSIVDPFSSTNSVQTISSNSGYSEGDYIS